MIYSSRKKIVLLCAIEHAFDQTLRKLSTWRCRLNPPCSPDIDTPYHSLPFPQQYTFSKLPLLNKRSDLPLVNLLWVRTHAINSVLPTSPTAYLPPYSKRRLGFEPNIQIILPKVLV